MSVEESYNPLVKKRSEIRMNSVLQAQNSRMSEPENLQISPVRTFGS